MDPSHSSTPTSTTPGSSRLFASSRVGTCKLSHRIVMAPLTRFRVDKNNVPLDMVVQYYNQRASVPGTLLISEALVIDPQAGGYNNTPGIYNGQQIAAWKKVTRAVHARGCFIYAQLWALGRAANPANLDRDGFEYASSSATPVPGKDRIPASLSKNRIEDFVKMYATAANNAMEAGFDGVELHAANGYLPDQFLQDTCNFRDDEYGGSHENRARFTLDVMDMIAATIGSERTAIRIAPWSRALGMGMEDPTPTFRYLVRELRIRHPHLAYLHVVGPVDVNNDVPAVELAQHRIDQTFSVDDIRALWAPLPFVVAGGYTPRTAVATADAYGDLVAFGRHFISNPDLPTRIRKGLPLTPYDRATFYTPGSATGYIDYPFAIEGDVRAML